MLSFFFFIFAIVVAFVLICVVPAKLLRAQERNMKTFSIGLLQICRQVVEESETKEQTLTIIDGLIAMERKSLQ